LAEAYSAHGGVADQIELGGASRGGGGGPATVHDRVHHPGAAAAFETPASGITPRADTAAANANVATANAATANAATANVATANVATANVATANAAAAASWPDEGGAAQEVDTTEEEEAGAGRPSAAPWPSPPLLPCSPPHCHHGTHTAGGGGEEDHEVADANAAADAVVAAAMAEADIIIMGGLGEVPGAGVPERKAPSGSAHGHRVFCSAGSTAAAAATSGTSSAEAEESEALLHVQIRAIMLQHAEDCKRMTASDAGRLAMTAMRRLQRPADDEGLNQQQARASGLGLSGTTHAGTT
jgi:hypothetical protein